MTEHLNISDFIAGRPVDSVYLVRNRMLRTAKDGSLYLQMEVNDATGISRSICWNITQELYDSFEEGSFVHLKGAVENYQGRLQIRVQRLSVVPSDQIRFEDFLPSTEIGADTMFARLLEIIDTVENHDIRRFLDGLFADDAFVEAFKRAPAGSRLHHARLGGLLEHTLAVTELALAACRQYNQIKRDLMIVGAVVHDIGKTVELSYETGFRYTNEGRLVGHLASGASMIDKVAARLTDFPDDLLVQLKHMALSHHGEHEWGSPKLPVTLEAVVLHFLDNLDAKVDAFTKAVADDNDQLSDWTGIVGMFDRMLYKG